MCPFLNKWLPFFLVQMGHATAEAVIRAGLTLVPFSFTGASEAVAVGNIGVCGIPVELVGPDERTAALQDIRQQYPGLVMVDYTLPSAVNGGKREGGQHAEGNGPNDWTRMPDAAAQYPWCSLYCPALPPSP